MNKPFHIPVNIKKRDEATEDWKQEYKVHARINTNYKRRGYERVEAGGVQIKRSLIFEFRYSKELAEIAYNTQLYALEYQGKLFNVIDYDDYHEEHRYIRLTGALI